MCLAKIRPHAQIMIIILSLVYNKHTWEDLYDHLMSTKIFTLIKNKELIWSLSSNNYEESGCNNLNLDLLIILY